MHNVGDIKQTEVHTAVPLVPGLSHHETEIAMAKLKSIHQEVVTKFRQY
jgi:hypothetical protein